MQFHVLTTAVSQFALGGTTGTVVKLDGIDWSREAVLLADMGQQTTGGYSVRFRGVRVVGNVVEATLEITRPRPGAMVIQVITRPYAVTTISRGLLPHGRFTVRFVEPDGSELGHVEAAT